MLAGWIVLCAGSGAALIDGAGRTLLVGVAYAEMALVAVLLVVAAAVTPFADPGRRCRCRRSALLAARRAGGQAAAGRRPVGAALGRRRAPAPASRRPDPVARRTACWPPLTLGVIGAGPRRASRCSRPVDDRCAPARPPPPPSTSA